MSVWIPVSYLFFHFLVCLFYYISRVQLEVWDDNNTYSSCIIEYCFSFLGFCVSISRWKLSFQFLWRSVLEFLWIFVESVDCFGKNGYFCCFSFFLRAMTERFYSIVLPVQLSNFQDEISNKEFHHICVSVICCSDLRTLFTWLSHQHS